MQPGDNPLNWETMAVYDAATEDSVDPLLSKNFRLSEFTTSETAARLGISMDLSVEDPAYLNLINLCVDILQPLRDRLRKPLIITSGYRPKKLNKAIGGSKHSQHIQGLAADFIVPNMKPIDVAQKIIDMDLPFDQLIHEFGRWVHVSIPQIRSQRRSQSMTAIKNKTLIGYTTEYLPGIQPVA